MVTLAVDIGNTLTKLGFYEGEKLLEIIKLPQLVSEDAEQLIKKYNVKAIVIGDVKGKNEELLNFLKNKIPTTVLNQNLDLPVQNFYKTPHTLGADRLANVLGAQKLCPHRNTMVVDLGTCLKFDFITSKNEYLGGSIAPGINLRLRSLHEFTGKLPRVSFEVLNSPIGKNTQESLQSGVYFGIRNEILGMIDYMNNTFDSPIIIGTGGDMINFDIQLKSYIFAEYLTLIGLNSILTICDEEK